MYLSGFLSVSTEPLDTPSSHCLALGCNKNIKCCTLCKQTHMHSSSHTHTHTETHISALAMAPHV